ncbi:MAG TPA: sigma-70 family RNA polymerase sigma factor [Phycisphaerales bacterium]|nr:sigma-70 family RNA polymerase sigma factor [Phycisphaerales bacterium]
MPSGSPIDRDGEDIGEHLRQAAHGDEQAWRAIVRMYHARVFGLIRSQCGDPDLAEEITQSVFCTIVTKIGSYTEQGKFESWLFRIATNRLRDEMRRRKRQARPVEMDTLGALANEASKEERLMGRGGAGRAVDHPEEGASDRELGALRDAMSKLSEADQMIVHLRHLAGLKFNQMAEVLGEPMGTVLARHHRALKKLKELMEQGGVRDGEE